MRAQFLVRPAATGAAVTRGRQVFAAVPRSRQGPDQKASGRGTDVDDTRPRQTVSPASTPPRRFVDALRRRSRSRMLIPLGAFI